MKSSLILRVTMPKGPSIFNCVKTTLADAGAELESTSVVKSQGKTITRDLTVKIDDDKRGQMEAAVNALDGINIRHVSDAVELAHLGGKLQVSGKRPITNLADLAICYTPGVAKVCKAIAADPDKAHNLTIKRNTVAVISDGSRVLALGNIGPYAAMPVMEGKAQLFRQFGGVDAFPICLDTQDPEEIIRTVKNIAPAFGGINLEDIASPQCYEIERRLQAELDIPVLHDDQHGTAIAVLAATINAVKLVRKRMNKLKVVASGVGAAGLACCKMLLAAGVTNLIGYNKGGAVYAGREGLSSEEQWLAANSNPGNFKGTMQEALVGADMFLGLSVPGVIKAEDLKPMHRDPIVFALANPVPEVDPEAAAKYARVIATGGSNYPNQINNALVFPGLFRGALDCRVRQITEEMKLAAARALADVIKPADRDDDHIIPNVFDTKVAAAVANAVVKVAIDRGLARRIPKS